MELCDLDQNGKIDYNEFIQAAVDHQSLINKTNVEQIFAMFDRDQDGKISKYELASIFGGSESLINDILAEVDKNGDQMISQLEFN